MGDLSVSDALAPVRALYVAMGSRDYAAAGACFSDDARWTLPGNNSLSGTHAGRSAIVDFLRAIVDRSQGTLRLELLDVAVGEEFVVAVQHATGASFGNALDVTACQLMRVEGGLIRDVRGHYSDQAALDRFFG